MNAKPSPSWGETAFVNGEWAMKYERETVLDAVSRCAVSLSTMTEDRTAAIDYVISMKETKVGMRIRRLSSIPSRTPTDITIRSKLRSRGRTELAKLHDGKIGMYVYAWVGDIGFKDVLEWVCFDVGIAIKAGLLRVTRRNEIWNKDGGSAFIVVPLLELEEHGALMARRKFGIAGSFLEIQAKWAGIEAARGCDHDHAKWVDDPSRNGRIRTACQCRKFIGYRAQ